MSNKDNIDMEELRNLFKLSNFRLAPKSEATWQKEINDWLEFFDVSQYNNGDTPYKFAGRVSLLQLRGDEEPARNNNLSTSQIKLFCPRFVDGFVALPEHNKNDPKQ